MAYWNGTVMLCGGVPVDDHNHPYFTSDGARYGWYSGYMVDQATDVAPVQPDAIENSEYPAIRYPASWDKCKDANYVVFQNTNSSPKYVYGKIEKIEYRTPETTFIHYSIDSWETYFNQLTIGEMFVEREHQTNDWSGSIPSYNNVVPEGLETGDFVATGDTYIPDYSSGSDRVLMFTTVDPQTGDALNGQVMQGVFSGVAVKDYAVTDASSIAADIAALDEEGKADAIVGMIQVPNFVVGGQSQTQSYTCAPAVDGYVPQNAKVLCYPYNFLSISNQQGSQIEYKYEYGENGVLNFIFQGWLSMQASMTCLPQNYKGQQICTDEMLMLSNFPQLTYSSNTFANWLAQNSASNAIKAAGALASIGIGVATGGVGLAVGAIGGATALSQVLASTYEHSIIPPSAQGTIGSTTTLLQGGWMKFNIKQMSVTAEVGERIDNYFSMFGYKTGRLKVPNLDTRPCWNYVKTVGCNVTGRCPQSHLDKIRLTFDNGVTLWKNGVGVGNYNRDNRG